MKVGTGTDSPASTQCEYPAESPRAEALPPDAQWAVWWDGLEDGLTTSRRAVLAVDRPTSDDEQEQAAEPA
ncbi:hypothetical protein [Archangium sp.]|uniref:hypothetical protein n=1 Tax=Archangium sp. TaxID=1872627 RepID=UPI00389AC60A